MTIHCEQIGPHRLYLGDCREVLPTLGKVDAIVSDPPYGMDWNTNTARFTLFRHRPRDGKRAAGRNDDKSIAFDDRPFDPLPFLGFDEVILWGANHFASSLPKGSTLVWIKQADHAFGAFLSDAEVAWQRGGHGVYCFRDFSMKGEVLTRSHPTQKPIPLMRWCISRTRAKTVCDPFMGSASTGVAAIQLGRRFIGIEIYPSHFATACRRITEAMKQPDLFIQAPREKPVQQALELSV
jgi:site-specific DNA-methyltransferase (adenine-specific)